MPHQTPEHLAYQMEMDIRRYPLPICMDPSEERKALWRRKKRLIEIAARFYRMKDHMRKKVGQPG